MKLIGADWLSVRNHDRLSKCIQSVNEQLGKQARFAWDKEYDLATGLQNWRKVTMTFVVNPRLFVTNDGQEVMAVRW
jgi:hypothetical protein